MNPWQGKPVTWQIDGQQVTAVYNPGEQTMMRTALDAGARPRELHVIHELKAFLDATIVDAVTNRRG